MGSLQEAVLNEKDIQQIDCNNPQIDHSVAARFGEGQEITVTRAGEFIVAVVEDVIPFSCPLLRPEGDRRVEDFLRICQDCPSSFVSFYLTDHSERD